LKKESDSKQRLLLETLMPIHIAVWACLLAIFSPKKFISFQRHHATKLDISIATEDERNIRIINKAFWLSLIIVATSAMIGGIVGLIAGQLFGLASSQVIAVLQVAGACVLLWGTLYVRGWEIETYDKNTFTERINQIIYRTLYCIGTGLLVASLTWTVR
jgi:uncharacterized membrane protein